jgi:hypothetical protein
MTGLYPALGVQLTSLASRMSMPRTVDHLVDHLVNHVKAPWQAVRMALTGKLGLLVAAAGVAHFAAPDKFEQLTKQAFPTNTADWVKRNGAAETAIGMAMMVRPTRKLGVLALLGYTGWLGYNTANAQG